MPGGESNIVFNNHISGGTGGRGGQAGRIGGRGGDGQAPHVRQSYKLVAENVTIDNRSTHTPELGDFEQIRRGDIDLRREIRLYVGPAIPSSVIARRMFSAQIRQQSEKSVILYEGEDAEEECRQYILKYANLWHPNIMQIFGVSNFGGKHAVIAQDSLIPHTEYLALHRHSVILRIFLLALWTSESEDIGNYLPNTQSMNWWIRHSTGRLCVDLESYGIRGPGFYASAHEHLDWNGSIGESDALKVLSIPQFHSTLVFVEFANHRYVELRVHQADVHMGAVIFAPPGTVPIEQLAEVAFLPDIGLMRHSCLGPSHVVMDDGWMRFNSGELRDYRGSIVFLLEPQVSAYSQWMSQANHIFKRLQINSRYEDYGLLDYIWVNIDVYMKKPGVEGSSPGYFFMSPVEHFTRASNALGFPQDPWFWSFDPTGKDRLAAEDAAKQGFPEVKMRMRLRTLFWDASVYDALRKFHTARGFDPDSQEVAIHLGYPLYQLASEREETFAHVDEQLEVPEPPAVDHSRGQQTREIGDIPLIPLNTSSALPEQVLAPATSARMAVPGNESSGLFNFFRNWETPEFGSLC